MIRKIGIAQAAALMGKGSQFLRVSLQRGLVPFGYAVKLQGEDSRFDYFINPRQFAAYLGLTEEQLKEELKNVTQQKPKGEGLNEPLFE